MQYETETNYRFYLSYILGKRIPLCIKNSATQRNTENDKLYSTISFLYSFSEKKDDKYWNLDIQITVRVGNVWRRPHYGGAISILH